MEVTSQTFCYHCVEYIKLDTCATFHDHWSNNNKVMMGGGGGGGLRVLKKPMSNKVYLSVVSHLNFYLEEIKKKTA